jgi:hypothetical protein
VFVDNGVNDDESDKLRIVLIGADRCEIQRDLRLQCRRIRANRYYCDLARSRDRIEVECSSLIEGMSTIKRDSTRL